MVIYFLLHSKHIPGKEEAPKTQTQKLMIYNTKSDLVWCVNIFMEFSQELILELYFTGIVAFPSKYDFLNIFF